VVLGSQTVFGEHRAHTQLIFRNMFPNSFSGLKESNNSKIARDSLIHASILIHVSIIKTRTILIMAYYGFLYY